MDVRAKQLLCLERRLLNSSGLLSGFAPRHLNRYASTFMRIKKALTIFLLLLIVLVVTGSLVFASFAYARKSEAVLFRVEDKADPVRTPFIFILNPFRDRSAENAAISFLERLKQGQCQPALAELNYPIEQLQDICERETNYPLLSWSLADREQQPSDQLRMYFWADRQYPSRGRGQMWVTVQKNENKWQVVDFECWY
jgi:hypothetical protein